MVRAKVRLYRLSTDGEFVVIISELDSRKEVCAWSGSADAVVVEFQHWRERKDAESAYARTDAS